MATPDFFIKSFDISNHEKGGERRPRGFSLQVVNELVLVLEQHLYVRSPEREGGLGDLAYRTCSLEQTGTKSETCHRQL